MTFYHTITNLVLYEEVKAELMDELKKTVIPMIMQGNLARKKDGSVKYIRQRGDIIGLIGRTINFGYGIKRCQGFGEFVANERFPDLWRALVKFAEATLPADFEWHTVTLNHNVKAKKHVDSYNVGESYIVGIGDYEGGKLRTYTNEFDYVANDIKDKPLRFNGALIAHETEDFTGERYTMIFYKQDTLGMKKPSSLDFV